MAVDLKIKSTSKQVSKKFKKFQSVLPRIIDKGVKQAGFQLIDIIRAKTQKGINFKDGAFAPYSQGYLKKLNKEGKSCLLYTSPSPRDGLLSRMPSSA